jgi:hypothetical protein
MNYTINILRISDIAQRVYEALQNRLGATIPGSSPSSEIAPPQGSPTSQPVEQIIVAKPEVGSEPGQLLRRQCNALDI